MYICYMYVTKCYVMMYCTVALYAGASAGKGTAVLQWYPSGYRIGSERAEAYHKSKFKIQREAASTISPPSPIARAWRIL
jgi:hypothetical protein